MLAKMLIAALLILGLLLAWLAVQQLARTFARRHPQWGPCREEGEGCGHGCGCHANDCHNKNMCSKA